MIDLPLFLFFLLFILFLTFNILYFLSPTLSPIPFFPTNRKDLSLIVNLLFSDEFLRKKQKKKSNVSGQLSNVIVDLGAGTGTVIFASAASDAAATTDSKNKFIAVEIHPLLIFIMHIRRLFHPHRKNIKIIRADIFKLELNDLIKNVTSYMLHVTCYLYVDPRSLSRLKSKLLKLPNGSRIVTYMYEIPGWKKRLKKTVRGVNNIYIY